MPKKPGASTDFRGLPIPMAAGFIASLTFLLIDLHQNDHELEVLEIRARRSDARALPADDQRRPLPEFQESRLAHPRHAAAPS